MANGFSSFKDDHHYATGIILILVGVVVGIAGATGTLAAALAALWTTPSDSLYEASSLNGGSATETTTTGVPGVPAGTTLTHLPPQ